MSRLYHSLLISTLGVRGIYTFSHPTGLLFYFIFSQFAKIALVVTGKAAFEDIYVKEGLC
jgi:hypothetical protein